MKLTDSELAIFRLLQQKHEVSLDEIMVMIHASRHSIVVRLKYLAAKLAPEGWIIRNSAGTGRGKKAIYSMEKKF